MKGEGGRILIVDDDPDFVESVAAFLEAHGHEVVRARDGREGLELARRRPPDLVLMDVMMGERTEGFFAVQQLRREPALARVPVFIVSSLYQDVPGFRIRPDAAWTGHDEFLAKPLDLDLLLEKIAARLAPAPGSDPRPSVSDR
jgi:CheY-like chemotaxis protein